MIKLGLMLQNYSLPGTDPNFEKLLRDVLKAERMGFDSVWVTDHLILGSKRVFPYLESLTTLAALASRTTSIKLGVCILVLPLREPVLLAKVISTLCHISKNRIILALGAGWYEREFRACGVDFNDRGGIMERKMVLLRKLLNEPDITLNAGEARFDHVTLLPQAEEIPLLMGGYVNKALERAGKLGDGWVPTSYTPSDFAEAWSFVMTVARDAGRDPRKLINANLVLACVDNNSSQERVKRFAVNYYDEVPWGKVKHVEASVSGDPLTCIEKIRKLEQVGVQNVILAPCDYEEEQIELLAKEVLPQFI